MRLLTALSLVLYISSAGMLTAKDGDLPDMTGYKLVWNDEFKVDGSRVLQVLRGT